MGLYGVITHEWGSPSILIHGFSWLYCSTPKNFGHIGISIGITYGPKKYSIHCPSVTTHYSFVCHAVMLVAYVLTWIIVRRSK